MPRGSNTPQLAAGYLILPENSHFFRKYFIAGSKKSNHQKVIEVSKVNLGQ